jgi:hypothetical protein
MGSIPIGIIIVTILFGSASLAMFAARYLPEHHLNAETKNVVSVSMAVVGTLSALVVSLLLSTAHSSFTAKSEAVTQISADAISLDRMLRRYGPDAQGIHMLVRQYTAATLQDLFPKDPHQAIDLEKEATLSVLEAVQDKIVALTPTNDLQRFLQAQALQLTGAITAIRWQLGQENMSKSPFPVVVMMIFWFVIIFSSYGLFAPRNMTAITAIFLCAVGIGGAIRMITELQTPFSGLIRISGVPLTQALEIISR